MRKSPLLLAILLLVLGTVLCVCSATVAFSIIQVVRTTREVDLPDMSQALRRSEGIAEATAAPLPDELQPGVTEDPVVTRVDRLVVQGADGNIVTMRPDGSERTALTTDAGISHIYRQPAWSSDAQRVAWTEIVSEENGMLTGLWTGLADGSSTSRTDMAGYAPFYLSWSPDSTRVAALSNWDAGLALRTVAVENTESGTSLLGQGQPFYFSWSPDSRSLLAHLDGQRVSVLSAINGAEDELDATAATFGAPQWGADGSSLVYARRENGQQQLVIADRAGTVQYEIAEFTGSVSFSLSPDGDSLAFVETLAPVATAALGTLRVAGTRVDSTREIDEGPVVGFFWSPDGRKLAYLVPGDLPEGSSASAPRTLEASHTGLTLRWRIWDGERTYDLSQFLPSDTFLLDYLRFFDQYSRSMTPWAPDGRAFVYAGESADGTSGVWVQAVEEGSPATRVSDGEHAAWSPR